MRKQKTTISYDDIIAEIAFTGDTTIDGISDEAKKSKILIMELTFIDDAISVIEARKRGHTHLYEFVDISNSFHNEFIIMTHFSARYKLPYIFDQLNKHIPEHIIDKIYLAVDGNIYKLA